MKLNKEAANCACRMPQVRKHTAEQLYLQLLGEDDEDGDAEGELQPGSGRQQAQLAVAAGGRLS